MEMALQAPDIGPLILVDIPYFDEDTKTKYAAGLDVDDPGQDAFRAAFAYDLGSAMERLSHKVICVAIESSLFEPTVKAAQKIVNSHLIERRDIVTPAFESFAIAELIRTLVL